MARAMTVAAVVAGAAGGAAALRGALGRAHGATGPRDGWLGVTVLRPADELSPGGERPEPLRRFGDRIEVRVQSAPGDRGTELYARPVDRPADSGLTGRLTGTDALADLRRALREAKSLAECGEVVQPDEPSTTHPGPGGRLIAALDRRAQGAGRL
jgi:hypothetical protein